MAFDLTLDAVEVALAPSGTEITTTDFVVAEWVREAPAEAGKPLHHLTTAYRYVKVTATVTTAGVKETDSAWVRILLGPGGIIAPAKGTYGVWVHITDSPEDLYLPAEGNIKIT